MKVRCENENVILSEVRCLSLPLTLDCGEAFRWQCEEDGSWSGAAYGKIFLNIKEEKRRICAEKNTSLEDF
ncbi:MAG: 8-oxoguanine DNA glycosylase, N-terminal domain-containing protein [Anaerotruncus sp.]|nr:MAG: 8-oxoguanine DNA glycosylase, N-terminal domain-containing protein [Anaerotruncus sp.]